VIAFSAPWALWGLAAVAVPLILHLVARREPPLVSFPAVRYLEDTARRHQRRFRLQHLLLLLVRMALIAALVLAASGPSLSGGRAGSHAPAALVLIVDNSLSAAAIVDGAPVLEELRTAAQRILSRAGTGDRIWLVAADGLPRTGELATLRDAVDQLVPLPLRLDLGLAIQSGQELLNSTTLPGEIIVLSDLQATAISAADGRRTVVGAASGEPPGNRGVASVETGPQPWGGSGRITTSIAGASTRPAALTVLEGSRVARQLLVPPGGTATTTLGALVPGWHELTIEIDPDELRLDDKVQVGVRVAPPAAVTWPTDGSHLADAAEVLLANGRLVRGASVWLDQLGSGPSIVFPPADPSALGALNRALVARGANWQFGSRLGGTTATDSTNLLGRHSVLLRHHLESVGGASGDVLLTAGGEPWMVRSGNVLLVASRFEPAWTALPLSAAFMPFMDLLLNRLARGETARLVTATGSPVQLPDRVTAVASPSGQARVEGGASWRPATPGLHWLLSGLDTIGVVESNHDPRESELGRPTSELLTTVWPGAEITTAGPAADLAFTRTGRADLQGPLLWLAALLAAAELLLAGLGRRGR